MSPIAAIFINQEMHHDGSLISDTNHAHEHGAQTKRETTRTFIDQQFVAIIYRADKKSNKFRISIRKMGNLYNELFLTPACESELFDLSQNLQFFRVRKSSFNELKLNSEAPKDSIVIMSGGELRYQLSIEFDEGG